MISTILLSELSPALSSRWLIVAREDEEEVLPEAPQGVAEEHREDEVAHLPAQLHVGGVDLLHLLHEGVEHPRVVEVDLLEVAQFVGAEDPRVQPEGRVLRREEGAEEAEERLRYGETVEDAVVVDVVDLIEVQHGARQLGAVCVADVVGVVVPLQRLHRLRLCGKKRRARSLSLMESMPLRSPLRSLKRSATRRSIAIL